MKTKKMKAFTISELLVVLVISSIVLSLTFVILGMTQKQIAQIQRGYQQQQEILLFKRVLLKDINTHRAFFKAKEEQLILSNSFDTIRYAFAKNYLLRDLDTFKLKIKERQLYLNNTIVTSHWIDAIQLEFEQTYTSKKIFMYKIKDAAHYLNQ